MKKKRWFSSILFSLCTVLLGLVASVADYSPHTAGSRQPVFGPKDGFYCAGIPLFFPLEVKGLGDVSQGLSPYCLARTFSPNPITPSPAINVVRPRHEYNIFVYTAYRVLVLYGSEHAIAVYPVAAGKDNAWLDHNIDGTPAEGTLRAYTVKRGDSFWSISRRFATDVWTLASFNGFTTETMLHPGQDIRIPKPDLRITPYGTFVITNKIVEPVFRNGENTIQPFNENKGNILGSRWIGLSNSPYGIHGTNSPKKIGTYSTRGCIRMLNGDIEELFNLVPIGTSVVIQRSPADESDAADVPPVEGRPPETRRLSSKLPFRAPAAAEKSTHKPPAPVKEPEVAKKKRYTVQVAALVVERNALALRARLEKLGFHPIIRTTTASITHHRVYAGHFPNRDEAEQTARRLNVDGFPSNLSESEDGFFVQVGSFFTLNEAIDLGRNLQKKNYPPKIVSTTVTTRIHAVRVGQYQSRSEALETLAAIKNEGLNPLLVRQ